MDLDLINVLELCLPLLCLILLLDPDLSILIELAGEVDHVGWLHLKIVARSKGVD